MHRYSNFSFHRGFKLVRIPSKMPEHEPNGPGCLLHALIVLCVPLFPLMWFYFLIDTGVGSDDLAFCLNTVVIYTLVTLIVHGVALFLIALSVSRRPLMVYPLFLLWIPTALLSTLAMVALWFWNCAAP